MRNRINRSSQAFGSSVLRSQAFNAHSLVNGDLDGVSVLPELDEIQFKVLETLCYMFGISGLLIKRLRDRKIPDGGQELLGSKEKLVADMQNALAEEARRAIVQFSVDDPAKCLNVVRRFLLRRKNEWKSALSYMTRGADHSEMRAGGVVPTTLALEQLGVESDDAAMDLLCDAMAVLVPKLEGFVGLRSVVVAYKSLGFKWHGANGQPMVSEDDVPSFDSPPKESLLRIASLVLRIKAIETIADDVAKKNPAASVYFASDSSNPGQTAGLVNSLLRQKCVERDPRAKDPSWLNEATFNVVWNTVLATRWAMSGFPAIAPSHRLAAANMATSIPEDLAPEIAEPWPTFVIDVPPGLFPGDEVRLIGVTSFGEIEEIARSLNLDEAPLEHKDSKIIVIYGAQSFFPRCYIADSLKVMVNAKLGQNIARCLQKDKTAADVKTSHHALDSREARVIELVGRLLTGCLVELDSEEHKNAIRGGRSASVDIMADERKRRGEKLPSSWVFQIKRDVKVDAREFVHDYIEHGSRKLSVQLLVRGHRKRQAHGPRASLRKWIHVEPYWRGPEDAPIAFRAHAVEGKEDL